MLAQRVRGTHVCMRAFLAGIASFDGHDMKLAQLILGDSYRVVFARVAVTRAHIPFFSNFLIF